MTRLAVRPRLDVTHTHTHTHIYTSNTHFSDFSGCDKGHGGPTDRQKVIEILPFSYINALRRSPRVRHVYPVHHRR